MTGRTCGAGGMTVEPTKNGTRFFGLLVNMASLCFRTCLSERFLTARPVAEAISARGKYRWRHRAWAQKMEILADFLEEPRADGMPPVFPRSRELAKMLRIAAQAYRGHVEATRYTPGVIRVSREAGAAEIFASQVSHYLKEVTGLWLDDQVAVLTEIAFPDVGDVDPEHVKRLRRSR